MRPSVHSRTVSPRRRRTAASSASDAVGSATTSCADRREHVVLVDAPEHGVEPERGDRRQLDRFEPFGGAQRGGVERVVGRRRADRAVALVLRQQGRRVAPLAPGARTRAGAGTSGRSEPVGERFGQPWDAGLALDPLQMRVHGHHSRVLTSRRGLDLGQLDRRRRRALPPVLPEGAARARGPGPAPRGGADRARELARPRPTGRSTRTRSARPTPASTTSRCGPARSRAATTACGGCTTRRSTPRAAASRTSGSAWPSPTT